MDTAKSHDIGDMDGSALQPPEGDVGETVAWELVDAGRYRPRRIRGSCRGRELG